MNEYYYSCQFLYVLLLDSNVWVTVIDLNCLELLIVELINRFISMYYHRFVYTLLNRNVHSVIDDITGLVARAGTTETALPAEEANQIPPGGLIEWTYI